MNSSHAVRSCSRFASFLLLSVALILQGCLADSEPEPNPEEGAFNVSLNIQNRSGNPVRNLKFQFTSNLQDTIDVGLEIPVLAPDSSGLLALSIEFSPLRWYNVRVQALDSAEAVLAQGNAGPISSEGTGDAPLEVVLVAVP